MPETESAIAADLANELRIPESAAAYRDIIESLPELMRVQAQCLAALADNLDEQAGPGLEATVGHMKELAEAAGGTVDPAEQAALAFGDEARFWLGGE